MPVQAGRRLPGPRLALGLGQGLALGLLVRAEHAGWAVRGGLWEVLRVTALYLPLVPLAGLGHMRAAPLLVWTALAFIGVLWLGMILAGNLFHLIGLTPLEAALRSPQRDQHDSSRA